ncbi:RNA polymerase III transcription factor IIIC subunit-domain-containing protein [Phycomyces nitens]|nr:RNA polymerase III transcription factor IIIC subunit-domain-containing protein [Phycomyces nitens]
MEESAAPLIPYGEKSYFCIEYPGYIKNVDRALESLGGEKKIATLLSKSEPIELRFRPKDPFSHPINGDIVPSSKLLLKVTRRVKKGRPASEAQLETQVMGQINKTCRFGGLADFQYMVPKNIPIIAMKDSILKGNVDNIMNHRIAEDPIDMNDLQNIPPPLFTVTETPNNYGYRQCSNVLKIRVRQPDGSFKIKLVNKSRKKGFNITSINFFDDDAPDAPKHDRNIEFDKYESTANEIRKLFKERDIWSRASLNNFLAPEHHKGIKIVLPSLAYTFRDGPWRSCWISFGMDPRKDPKYARYQQIYIRKLSPHGTITTEKFPRSKRKTLPRFLIPEPSDNTNSGSAENSKINDPTEPSPNAALYQLCDIQNEDIKKVVNNPAYVKDFPTKHAGFYYNCVLICLRNAIRKKHNDMKERGVCEIDHDLEKDLPEQIEKEKEAILQADVSEESTNAFEERNRAPKGLEGMTNSFIDRMENGDIYADDDSDMDDIDEYEDMEADEDIEEEVNEDEDDDDDDDDEDIIRGLNKLDKGKRVRLQDLELDELLK